MLKDMQFYQGPSHRTLARHIGSAGFTVDGKVGHTEDRDVYVKQKFIISQTIRDVGVYNTRSLTPQWLHEEEKSTLAGVEGDQIPFSDDHSITDRLMVNRTFKNVTFEPDGCRNVLNVDSLSESRIAPLLCSHTSFDNVTKLPVLSGDASGIPTIAYVQMGAYDRLWFGAVVDYSAAPLVTNVIGNGPYTLTNQAAVAPNNPALFLAYGFLPTGMGANQKLRVAAGNTVLGKFDINGDAAGVVQWAYDKKNDLYYHDSFEVTINWPLDQKVTTRTFTVPRLETTSPLSYQSDKLNYYFRDDVGETSDVFPSPARIVVANVANETRSSADFVRVKIGVGSVARTGDGTLRDICMFVPAFRIVKGNRYSSVGRPRRYATSVTDVRLQPWINYNIAPLDLTDLASQVPFWGYYQNNHGKFTADWDGGESLFALEKIGEVNILTSIAGINDTNPMFLIEFETDDSKLSEDSKALIERVRDLAVTNKLNNQIQEIACVYKYQNQYGYYRLRLGSMNTFKNVAGNYEQNLFGGKIAAGYQAFRNANWNDDRSVQIEIPAAGMGLRLKPDVSPFRDEAGYTTAARVAGQVGVPAANRIPEVIDDGKPFHLRSVYNFVTWDFLSGAPPRPGQLMPQQIAVGQQNAGKLATQGEYDFYDDGEMELYLPVRRDVINTHGRPLNLEIDSVEPFFGYCSGTSQLECQYPCNTSRLGEFPLLIQDYTYNFGRDYSNLFRLGYIHDEGMQIQVTAKDPVFTTVSDKYPDVNQEDKSIGNIQEVTHTIDRLFQTVVKEGKEPYIQFEPRSGMFEYLFLWVDYPVVGGESVYGRPLYDPVITNLSFKVRGRENQFVKSLDSDDLERLSRSNCHKLCNWRDWHEQGRGILLHLADIGLTEEAPFPKRMRIQLEVTCKSMKHGVIASEVPDYLRFNLVQLRNNRLFTGDITGTTFEFLNEKLLK